MPLLFEGNGIGLMQIYKLYIDVLYINVEFVFSYGNLFTTSIVSLNLHYKYPH